MFTDQMMISIGLERFRTGARFSVRRRRLVVAMLVPLLMAMVVPSSSAARRMPGVPARFFGIAAGSTLLDGQVNLNTQLARMHSVGTGIIRFPIYWSAAQPYRSWRGVPAGRRGSFTSVDGHPTTFRTIDSQILAFAKHGLQVLPVVVEAPPWARLKASLTWSPPAHAQDYGRFVGALVSRYGTRGAFWRKHSQLARYAPRWWQIWNEPAGGDTPEGHTVFWDGPKPYEPRYISILRAARQAARKADPNARIVLAGFFGDSWDALSGIYHHGGRGLFDAVAVHPYADSPAHVLTILQYVRQVMSSEHDNRLPLLVTETGWPSPDPGTAVDPGIYTTETGQASNLAGEYPLLVARRRELNLQAIFWYTWIGPEPSSVPFDYSGLVRLTPDGTVQSKPALSAYTSTLHRLEHEDPAAAFEPEPGL